MLINGSWPWSDISAKNHLKWVIDLTTKAKCIKPQKENIIRCIGLWGRQYFLKEDIKSIMDCKKLIYCTSSKWKKSVLGQYKIKPQRLR